MTETATPVDMAHALARAQEIAKEFEGQMDGVPYEAKGVLFSETLFVRAAVGARVPRQVLESGRARGQSTHTLALCFPDSHIASVEYRADSPDVAVAEKRLSGLPNVYLLYGDAREIIRPLLLNGDAVLIDGPKGFRALALAFDLLGTGRPLMVFVHDCHQNTPARRFLERYVPGAFYSDDPEFVKRYSYLDENCTNVSEEDEAYRWSPYDSRTHGSYGPTFACIPWNPVCRFRWLAHLARAQSLLAKWRKSLARMLRGKRRG